MSYVPAFNYDAGKSRKQNQYQREDIIFIDPSHPYSYTPPHEDYQRGHEVADIQSSLSPDALPFEQEANASLSFSSSFSEIYEGIENPSTAEGNPEYHQLLAQLFPYLSPLNSPPIPATNPEKIHQVEAPLNDIYRPRWIRKECSEREGWCGYCTPGTWANLKHSNYAYHMLKRHGLCKSLGKQLDPPQALEMTSNTMNNEYGDQSPILFAYCQNCQKWVELVGNT